jgi:hypothetical protein
MSDPMGYAVYKAAKDGNEAYQRSAEASQRLAAIQARKKAKASRANDEEDGEEDGPRARERRASQGTSFTSREAEKKAFSEEMRKGPSVTGDEERRDLQEAKAERDARRLRKQEAEERDKQIKEETTQIKFGRALSQLAKAAQAEKTRGRGAGQAD